MRVNVVGRRLALGSDEVAHAEAEAEKLGKFFDGVNDVSITFEWEHTAVKAEIICAVSGGKTLVAVESGRTVDEALEFASDAMARQIKRYKAKLRGRKAHGVPHEEKPESPEGGSAEET